LQLKNYFKLSSVRTDITLLQNTFKLGIRPTCAVIYAAPLTLFLPGIGGKGVKFKGTGRSKQNGPFINIYGLRLLSDFSHKIAPLLLIN